METKKRPTVVSIAAWVILILSGLGLISSLLTPVAFFVEEAKQKIEESGQSVASVIIWGVVAGAIGLISGIAILNGLNWGRILYLVFAPVVMVLQWFLHGFDIKTNSIGIVIYVLLLILLTTAAASKYFSKQPEPVAVSEPPDVQSPE